MKQITSLENREIKYAVSLQQKKYRDREGRFLVEGFKSVAAVISRQELIDTVFLDETRQQEFSRITEFMPEQCCLVDSKIIRHICTTETPQGIAAIVKKAEVELQDLLSPGGVLILLDRISDPGNMGTIIRSAWALNAGGVLLTPGCVDPFNPKVVRSTMGGIFNVPLVENVGIEHIKKLKDKGFKIICSALDTERSFYDADYRGRKIVVIGSEAVGISRSIIALADDTIKIPINPRADSLNAAVACAIIIQEALRQRTPCSSLC